MTFAIWMGHLSWTKWTGRSPKRARIQEKWEFWKTRKYVLQWKGRNSSISGSYYRIVRQTVIELRHFEEFNKSFHQLFLVKCRKYLNDDCLSFYWQFIGFVRPPILWEHVKEWMIGTYSNRQTVRGAQQLCWLQKHMCRKVFASSTDAWTLWLKRMSTLFPWWTTSLPF